MSEKTESKVYMAKETIPAICLLFVPALILQVIIFAVSVFLWGIVLFIVGGLAALAVVGIFELVFGVTMVGIGIEKLFSMPMGAFAVMGFGIANIGIALLIESFVLWLFGVLVPSFFRKIKGKEAKNEKIS